MTVGMFPADYRNKINQEVIEKIQKEDNDKKSRINNLYHKKTMAPASNGYTEGWTIAGLIIGLFSCMYTSSTVSRHALSERIAALPIGQAVHDVPNGYLQGGIVWIICAVAGFFIGKVIYNSTVSRIDSHNRNIDMSISLEEKSFEQKKEELKSEGEVKFKSYVRDFEQAAQNKSVRYADSELAIEVIEWMTVGFCKTIDAADRRSHVEKVNVPFSFSVYRNKITCNLGTYDFELNRCCNLENPLEQTALARAIVTAIRINISEKYPMDVSGTNKSVEISYDYTSECSVVTITYIAPNGGYRQVRNW